MISEQIAPPYYPISKYYATRFGEKVYKIPVTVADDCPNRRGLRGMQTCVFCDEWGSAANKDSRKFDLRTQIEQIKAQLEKKYHARKFLVYFQAYTNTFLKLQVIRDYYETALSYPDVVGLVIGTRPDCLSKAVFETWNSFADRTPVFVEFGVQTFNDEQLDFLRRGHTAKQSIDAILTTKREANVNIGIHLMFGLPGETDEQMIETAKLCAELPIDNVKLHNLHVLKNTPLAEMYARGEFKPADFETYSRRVRIFLQHLPARIAVHRLGAVASRWDELIAPEWTRYKMQTFQEIVAEMRTFGAFQGQFSKPSGGQDLEQSDRNRNEQFEQPSFI